MPAYNDTPLATNPINQTQGPIRTNFSTLETTINVNHVDFASADFGKHKWVTFTQQAQATAQAANTYPDLAIYNAQYITSGQNELWFRNSTNVIPDVPFTAAEYSATTGWTWLPSGIVLKWGVTGEIGGGNAAGNVTVNATQGPSIPSAQILSVQITAFGVANIARNAYFGGVTGVANSFVVRSSTGIPNPGANYLLIGYP